MVALNSTGAGRDWLLASTVTEASVTDVVALSRVKPKNSSTSPVTSTWSPTLTVTVPSWRTKMPSEVSASLSLLAVGVWMKKPPAPTAVTTLSSVVARFPNSGLAAPLPWIS